MSSRNHIKDNYKSQYDMPTDATDEFRIFPNNVKDKFTVCKNNTI